MLKEVKGILDGYLKSAPLTLAFFALLSGLSLVVGRLIYADWADRNGIYKAVGEPWEYVALGALPSLALAICILGLHLGIKIRKKDNTQQKEFLAEAAVGFYVYFILSFILAIFLIVNINNITSMGFLVNFVAIAAAFLTLSVVVSRFMCKSLCTGEVPLPQHLLQCLFGLRKSPELPLLPLPFLPFALQVQQLVNSPFAGKLVIP